MKCPVRSPGAFQKGYPARGGLTPRIGVPRSGAPQPFDLETTNMSKSDEKRARLFRAIARARTKPRGDRFLANALSAVASSMSLQLFPEAHPFEAATRPFVGALAHRAIDWVGETRGRRIVIEQNAEGNVEIWAEEDGHERRRFGFEAVKGGL